MKADVAVVTIHGIGDQKPGYSESMVSELRTRLDALGHDPHRVAFEEVYWAHILQPRQERYLEEATVAGDLDFRSLRKFVVSALGDAAAYRKISTHSTSVYRSINDELAQAVRRLEDAVAHPQVPLLVLAHSLGGHIASCHIWDVQHWEAAPGDTPFATMQTLAGMVTFGCNIPLFTMAYNADELKPIRFPGLKLRPEDAARARWLNFYDPHDVLGYPLRPLNAAYRELVEDRVVQVGSVFTSWNPLSHNGYWTDGDVTKPTAQFISQFL